MTGSVGSWKTEKIGFEVAGRVVHVLEPNADVEGRVLDASGEAVLTEGTVLARLDDQRYRIAAEAAQAAIDIANQRRAALQVDIMLGIPARILAAEAEQGLAKVEFDRRNSLVPRDVISPSEVDTSRTTLKTADATLKARNAELAAKEAELGSVEAQVKQAQLRLKEAERDRRDTALYSSFRGQVAQVHVVPGSYVDAGEPVLTIQMMDPIKVELELSAAMSRKFRYGDTIRLFATGADEQPIPLTGFVYMADPVADTETRTFTVTMLVRNRKLRPPIPPIQGNQRLARTKDIWPLNMEPIVGGGAALMVEASALRHDSAGAFLWKVTNRHIGEISTRESRVLKVVKVRVTPGDQVIPFLGTWKFIPIAINAGETFDPSRDVVAGDITVGEGDADAWSGDQILLDRSSWLLRPGDLVQVNLPNGDAKSGLYVPVRAIRHTSGQTSIFVADAPHSGPFVARQVEVSLTDTAYASGGAGVLRRIEPINGALLTDGARLIVEGAHFLADGDPIAIVDRPEDVR